MDAWRRRRRRRRYDRGFKGERVVAMVTLLYGILFKGAGRGWRQTG